MLRQVRSDERAEAEVAEVRSLAAEEREAQAGGWRDLAVPWIRRLVLIGAMLGVFQQFTGINSVMYYGTQILTDAGFAADAAIGPYLIMVFILGFIFSMQGTLGPLVWLMFSEIFPLRIRSFAMGLSVFVLWIAHAVAALAFPPVVEALTIAPTFFIFAAIAVLGLVCTHILVPETKDRSLEQLEAEFQARMDAEGDMG